MDSQAQRDRADHDAKKCEVCGALPIGGHRLVSVAGEMRDCPNAGTMNIMAPRCYGAETVDKKPACPIEPVRDVAFKAPGSDEWRLTQWCDDCRQTARKNGYQTYTWSKFVGVCVSGCRQQFRASIEHIESSRDAMYGALTDDEIVASWDYCLNCVEALEVPGEHDIPANSYFVNAFQIGDLTAQDVFAIAAALEVACDDEDEPYPGLRDALAKVEKVVKDLRSLGYASTTEEDEEPLYMQIAHAFGEVIHRETTPEQMAEINRRNAAEPNPSVCHTHDFADANEWMAEAFKQVMLRDVDITSDTDNALWNRAWTHAKSVGFYADTGAVSHE